MNKQAKTCPANELGYFAKMKAYCENGALGLFFFNNGLVKKVEAYVTKSSRSKVSFTSTRLRHEVVESQRSAHHRVGSNWSLDNLVLSNELIKFRALAPRQSD